MKHPSDKAHPSSNLDVIDQWPSALPVRPHIQHVNTALEKDINLAG